MIWLDRGVRVVRNIVTAAVVGWLLWTELGDMHPVSCSYSGAPRNVLTVNVKDASNGEIRRAGGQIVVAEPRADEPQVFCSGGTPTIRNTDTIRVKLDRFSELEVLAGQRPVRARRHR